MGIKSHLGVEHVLIKKMRTKFINLNTLLVTLLKFVVRSHHHFPREVHRFSKLDMILLNLIFQLVNLIFHLYCFYRNLSAKG